MLAKTFSSSLLLVLLSVSSLVLFELAPSTCVDAHPTHALRLLKRSLLQKRQAVAPEESKTELIDVVPLEGEAEEEEITEADLDSQIEEVQVEAEVGQNELEDIQPELEEENVTEGNAETPDETEIEPVNEELDDSTAADYEGEVEDASAIQDDSNLEEVAVEQEAIEEEGEEEESDEDFPTPTTPENNEGDIQDSGDQPEIEQQADENKEAGSDIEEVEKEEEVDNEDEEEEHEEEDDSDNEISDESESKEEPAEADSQKASLNSPLLLEENEKEEKAKFRSGVLLVCVGVAVTALVVFMRSKTYQSWKFAREKVLPSANPSSTDVLYQAVQEENVEMRQVHWVR